MILHNLHVFIVKVCVCVCDKSIFSLLSNGKEKYFCGKSGILHIMYVVRTTYVRCYSHIIAEFIRILIVNRTRELYIFTCEHVSFHIYASIISKYKQHYVDDLITLRMIILSLRENMFTTSQYIFLWRNIIIFFSQ